MPVLYLAGVREAGQGAIALPASASRGDPGGNIDALQTTWRGSLCALS